AVLKRAQDPKQPPRGYIHFLATSIHLWETATGKKLRAFGRNAGRTSVLTFSGESKTLAAIDDERVMRLWDVATGKELIAFGRRFDQEPPTVLALSPDGRLLAGGGPGQLRFWDATTGKEQRLPQQPTEWVFCLAFSPDGQTLAAIGREAVGGLWDVA